MKKTQSLYDRLDIAEDRIISYLEERDRFLIESNDFQANISLNNAARWSSIYTALLEIKKKREAEE